MIIVKYALLFNGREARSESLYVASMRAAKQLLSRKIPALYHIHPIGNWERCGDERSFTKRFANEHGGSYLLYLKEDRTQTPPIQHVSEQLTLNLRDIHDE